jgi:hypothetical protein
LVPTRAIGGVLRAVRYDDKPLSYIAPEDVGMSDSGTPRAVAFEACHYMPYPTPSTGTLQVSYMMRHSKLVKTDQAALISSVNVGANTVICSNVPSTLVAGGLCDVVGDCQGIDITIVSINGSIIELSSLPDGIKAGSYVCVAGETATVNIPQEIYPALSKAVQMRILESQGELETYAVTKKEFEDCLEVGRSILSPRLVSSTAKIKLSPFYNRTKRWR